MRAAPLRGSRGRGSLVLSSFPVASLAPPIMIRVTLEFETDVLLAIAEKTAVFKPLDLEALREVLDDYHAGNHHAGHRAVTLEEGGQPLGFAYYAPTPMTDRSWHLYWIFISKVTQGKGVGT